MKNKIIIIFIIILIILLATGVYIYVENNKSTKENTIEIGDKIEGKDIIAVGEKTWIKQLTDIKIKDTDDTFKITEFRKWEFPENDKEKNVSFSINIPYLFNVDNKEYSGLYILGDNSYSEDENPKYKLSVENLKSNGDIEILIEKK